MIFKILRNVASLLSGQAASKVIALVCTIWLARRWTVDEFGLYGTVTAYLSLFVTIADNGISTVTIRDVAQDYERSDAYFAHGLALRMLLSAAAYGAMLALGRLWQPPALSLLFIAGCGVFLFPEALRKLGVSLFTAYERMAIVAALDVLSIICRYAPFFLALVWGKSVYFGFLLLVVFRFGLAALWLALMRRDCLSRWFTPISWTRLRELCTESLPFGILFILSIIYFKADILMLARMQGSTAVGLYEGAYKFIDSAIFIPASIVSVLLPVMARTFATDRTSYHNVYVHSTRLLAMAILPVIVFVTFIAGEILVLVYKPDYLPAAPALSLLIWTLFFMFINAPVSNIIATSNLMRAFLPYAVANTLLNVVLNLWFIPRYSFLGASFTTVLTECTGFAIQLYFANRVLGNARHILWIFGKLFAAALITSLAVYILKASGLVISVIGLLSVYSGCLVVFKLVSAEDVQLGRELIGLLRKRLRKTC
jgi:O-antigen/teichoic acid export membrane protein